MADPIRVEVQATDVKYRQTLKGAEIFARDTKVKLDKASLINLELNVAEFQVKLDKARQELREAKKQWDRDAEIRARLETNELQRNLTEAKRQLNNYVNTWDKSLSRLQAKFNSVNKTIERQGLVMRDVIRQIFSWDFRGAIESFSDGVRDLNANVWDSWRTAWAANTRFGILGKTLTSTTVIIWGLISAVWALSIALFKASKNAISFESAFAGVRKTVNASEDVLQWIRKEILELSKEIPVTVEELAKIGELGWQLGIAPENLTKFIKTVSELWVTTNLATEDAATALARVANITNLTQEEFSNFWSALVELGNNFATTERDIVSFTERIAWAWQIAWLTPPQILALATAFSSVGIEAEAWGTAVQKVLLALNSAVQAWSVELEQFAAIAWSTWKEFAKQFESNAGQAFAQFVDWLSRSGKQASEVLKELNLSDVRLQRAFLSLAQNSDLLTDAIDKSNKAFTENNALSKEAIVRFWTTESRLQLLKNERRTFSIIVWDAFNKVFIPLLIQANNILTGETVPAIVEFWRLFSAIFRRIKPLIEVFVLWPLKTLSVFLRENFTTIIWLVKTLTNLVNWDLNGAFNSFWATASNVLIGVQNLINAVIDNANKLIWVLNRIPRVSIGTLKQSQVWEKLVSSIWLDKFQKEANEVIKTQDSLLKKFDPQAVLKEVNSRFWGGWWKKPFEDLLAQLDDIGDSAVWWWSKVKDLKEETDEYFELLNERATWETQLDRIKEWLEANEKAMQDIQDKWEIVFDALWDAIEDSAKTVEKLRSEIWKVDDELKSIEEKIAERFLELPDAVSETADSIKEIEEEIENIEGRIQSELRWENGNTSSARLDELREKREQLLSDLREAREQLKKLEEELALSQQNVNEETANKLLEEQQKSETQKLIERQSALEEEKKQLENKVNFEIQQQEKLAEKKKEIEENFTIVYWIELEKQTEKFKEEIAKRIKAYQELQDLQAWWWTTTVNNSQTNNFNVSNNVDLESALNQRTIKWQDIFN